MEVGEQAAGIGGLGQRKREVGAQMRQLARANGIGVRHFQLFGIGEDALADVVAHKLLFGLVLRTPIGVATHRRTRLPTHSSCQRHRAPKRGRDLFKETFGRGYEPGARLRRVPNGHEVARIEAASFGHQCPSINGRIALEVQLHPTREHDLARLTVSQHALNNRETLGIVLPFGCLVVGEGILHLFLRQSLERNALNGLRTKEEEGRLRIYLKGRNDKACLVGQGIVGYQRQRSLIAYIHNILRTW